MIKELQAKYKGYSKLALIYEIAKIREDTINECIEKLYEVTPQTIDQKLDMVFVNALRELKEQKNDNT